MSEYPRAVIREIDGQTVLDDPDVIAVMRAVAKHNCRETMRLQADRVAYYVQRMDELGRRPEQVLMIIANVDDVHGGPVADLLMPDTNWQEYRDRNETPFARGLAMRQGIEELIRSFDLEAAEKLGALNELAVVVIDHGVFEVFVASEAQAVQ